MPICNFPTPLRRALLNHDEGSVKRVLEDAPSKEAAAKLINADHSPDCLLRCCESVRTPKSLTCVVRTLTCYECDVNLFDILTGSRVPFLAVVLRS